MEPCLVSEGDSQRCIAYGLAPAHSIIRARSHFRPRTSRLTPRTDHIRAEPSEPSGYALDFVRSARKIPLPRCGGHVEGVLRCSFFSAGSHLVRAVSG